MVSLPLNTQMDLGTTATSYAEIHMVKAISKIPMVLDIVVNGGTDSNKEKEKKN
jgi:hypothetical protein